MPFRTKLRRWAGPALLALLSSALLAGCDKSPSIILPNGPVAQTEATLWWIILGIATFVFLAVTSALIYSIIRFRDRPGAAPARQLAGNTTLEITWTIVPSVVLLIVLVLTIGTMFALQQPSGKPTITVTAIGHQWWWEFQYPDSHVVTGDELHVPLNTVVHVDLRSDNVIHSFWIPQLAGKTDVIPGHNNSMWFEASKPGKYRGECAEFCGTQHAHMDFIVVAESQSDYQAWVQGQQQVAAAPTTAQEQQGQSLFKSQGCANCHVIDGVNKPTVGTIGPNLTHFGGRIWIAGGVVDNTPQNLSQWIYDAQSVKNGVDMPAFNGSNPNYSKLTPDQVSALVAYLESLK